MRIWRFVYVVLVVTSLAGSLAGLLDAQQAPNNSPVRIPDAIRFAHKFEGADALAQIASAIADLPSTGGTVDARALQGAQTFASNLTITKPVKVLLGAIALTGAGQIIIGSSGVTIEGSGSGQTTIQNTTANAQVIVIADGLNDVEISHLKVKDTGTFNVTYRGRALIQVNPTVGTKGTKRVNIHDVWFAAGAISGFSGNYILDSHIHHNHFEADSGAFGEHGVYTSGGSHRVQIDHNVMKSVGVSNGAGITSNGAVDGDVSDIEADSNFVSGFSSGIEPSSSANSKQPRWTITNNTLVGTSDSVNSGINLFSVIPTFSIISNNVTVGFTVNGLRSTAGIQDSVISNNIFASNGQAGTRISGMTRCMVTGNVFRDNDSGTVGTTGDTSAGIRLAAANTNNVFSGNVANNSTPGSFQKYGISMGSGQTGNYFLLNVVSSNRTADLDVCGVPGNYWVQPSSVGELRVGELGACSAPR